MSLKHPVHCNTLQHTLSYLRRGPFNGCYLAVSRYRRLSPRCQRCKLPHRHYLGLSRGSCSPMSSWCCILFNRYGCLDPNKRSSCCYRCLYYHQKNIDQVWCDLRRVQYVIQSLKRHLYVSNLMCLVCVCLFSQSHNPTNNHWITHLLNRPPLWIM